jgi:hypothetical protein
MYAKVDPDEHEEEVGQVMDMWIFLIQWHIGKKICFQRQLNAPWGVAAAPAGFWGEGNGEIQNVILIGNFGDGRINAFDENGKFLGQLRSKGKSYCHRRIVGHFISSHSATAHDPGRLYFASRPADEEDGLFGYIDK